MDWLERWFGLNPDGGSGAMEAEILVVSSLVLAAVVLVFWPRARARAQSAMRAAAAALRLRGQS